MAYTIRPKYDTAEAYSTLNRIYEIGTLLSEEGTDGFVRLKVADGVTAYNDLPYVMGSAGGVEPNQAPGFGIVAVPGQSDIVVDDLVDTLTITGSNGISVTTDAGTDTLTVSPIFGSTSTTICSGDDPRLTGSTSTGFVYVDSYGAAGNGTTDDSTEIQAAIDAMAAAGGGRVLLSAKKYKISSSIEIKPYCVLYGNAWPGGQTSDGNYSSLPYCLLVVSPATITLDAQSGISGINIVNSVYSNPTTIVQAAALVRSYTGTAITINGNDTFAENLFIICFATAYSSNGFARMHVNNIIGDNHAGFLIDECHDTARISNVHFWNYVTGLRAWTVTTFSLNAVANNGSGLMRVTTTASHGLITGDIITISAVVGTYDPTGAKAINSRWVVTRISNTQLDLQGSNFVGTTYTSGGTVTVLAGWRRDGAFLSCSTSESIVFTNCQAFGYQYGCRVRTGGQWITLVGCAFDDYWPAYDNSTTGLFLETGSQSFEMVGGFITSYGTPVFLQSNNTTIHTLVSVSISPNGSGSNWGGAITNGRLAMIGCSIAPGPRAASLYVYNAVSLFHLSACQVGLPIIYEGTAAQGATYIDGRKKNSGVPASTGTTGDIYCRTDGGVGSTLYVYGGDGQWRAVSGV